MRCIDCRHMRDFYKISIAACLRENKKLPVYWLKFADNKCEYFDRLYLLKGGEQG